MITKYDRNLAHAVREMVANFNRMLRKQINSPEELSVAEENVIRQLINKQEEIPSMLCKRLKISSQFMSQVLTRLEKLGYISRQPSKTDKRKSLIFLSKSGLNKLHQRRKKKEEFLASLISKRYRKKEKDLLGTSLSLMAQLYEDI
jgi:DNA-binding MarR family transcriptional regulator